LVSTDYSALLLKLAIQIAELIQNVEIRGELLNLADRAWDHLVERRIKRGPGTGLWDQSAEAHGHLGRDDGSHQLELPSWHSTLAVVDGLSMAMRLAYAEPPPSGPLQIQARDLLAEAEHLFEHEMVSGRHVGTDPSRQLTIEKIRHDLSAARDILGSRPGTATAILLEVLQDLRTLSYTDG
jgi:hypothetical protein